MLNAIPDQILDDIRERVDLVELASEYLSLKKSGENFKALCPFHTEKTPSFVISQKKQIFHCFGCGMGGNVYSFIMKMENLDFPEAVRRLADRCGVSLPVSSKTDRFKEELFRINELARDFYCQNLKTKEGRIALKYLQDRGLNKEAISSFMLGYATSGWTDFRDFALKKGFGVEEIERAGLIILKKDGHSSRVEDYYDRFRERIIFPIHDQRGMVVGFGGRVLGEGMPKYLNSPETPVYNKGQTLYGLNLAKIAIREQNLAIIVEGYIDVIILHQYGFNHTVGSCGTSLTQAQARLLRRYTREVTLVYDPDPAGMEATQRGLDLLNEEGLEVKVVQLPQGLDPADFVVARGPEEFRRFLSTSQNLFDYRLNRALDAIDISSPEGKSKVANEVIPIIIKTRDQIQAYTFIKRLSEVLHLSEEVILAEIRSKGRRKRSNQDQIESYIKGGPKGIIECERDLIRLMFLDDEVVKEVFPELEQEDFEDDLARKVAHLLKGFILKGERPQVKKVLDLLEDEEKNIISSLFLREKMDVDRVKLARAYLARMRQNRLNREKKDLKEKIDQAERAKDDSLKALLSQYQSLIEKISLLRQGVLHTYNMGGE